MQALTVNEIEQVNGGGMINESYYYNTSLVAASMTWGAIAGAKIGAFVGGPTAGMIGMVAGAYVGLAVGMADVYSSTNIEATQFAQTVGEGCYMVGFEQGRAG